MRKKAFIISLLILQSLQGFSNQNKTLIDSLLQHIEKANKDSILVNNYLYLSSYYFEKNLSKSCKYANLALNEATVLNYSTGQAQSLFLLAQTEQKNAELKQALAHFKESTSIYAAKGQEYYIARGFAEIGNTHASLGEITKALYYLHNSIEVYQKIKNQVGIASCYSDLGKVHHSTKNFNQALKYFKKAKIIFSKEKDDHSLARLYNRISIIFRDKGNIKQSLEYDYLALMMQEKLRDKTGMANSSLNIGETSIIQKELDIAIGHIEYAMKLYEETEDQIGIAKSYLIASEIHLLDKNTIEARRYLLKCIQISEESGAVVQLSKAYKLLSKLYSDKYEFENAYKYILKHNNLIDSLFSKEKTMQITSMEVKYHTLEKEKLVHDLEVKNVESSNKALTITISFFLGTGIFIVIVVILRKRQKEAQAVNLHLENKNKLIEKKNNEILDSILYAKRIQEAMLTSNSYIDRIFEECLIIYRPKDIVSGDFYWAYSHENTVFWATADCTGHGVPGALMSMIGTVLLNEAVIVKKENDPGEILMQINAYLKRYLNRNDTIYQTQDGMDISFCKLDKDKMTLEVAAATHSVYVYRLGILTELKGDKITLGQDPFGREIKKFTVHQYQLQKDDVIYSFTDGLPDQIGGPKKKKYKVGALKNQLSLISDRPLAEQRLELKNVLSDWQGENPQLDDILIMGVKV
jgi:serine phosphatase RsbU (regulator of sigma subunit)